MKKLFSLFFLLLLLSFNAVTTNAALVTIPPANTNTNSDRHPYGCFFGYERTALIYTSTEIGSFGSVTSIAFFVNAVTAPAANTPVTIKMMQTSLTTMTSVTYASISAGATTVWTGSVPGASLVAGTWYTVVLTTPFNYSSNNLMILVETDFTGSGGEATGTAKQFRRSAPTPAANLMQVWNQDTSPPTGTGTTVAQRSNLQVNVVSAANDVGPTANVAPTDTPLGGPTIAPKAIFKNYGSANQLVPFNVTYKITGANKWQSTKTDTISAGLSNTVRFDSTFVPDTAGVCYVTIYSSLGNDTDRTNDTLKTSFIVYGGAMAGDYTVGSLAFNRAIGKNIYFENVLRKVKKVVPMFQDSKVYNPEKGTYEESINSVLGKLDGQGTIQEVEEYVSVAMENGVEYKGPLYVSRNENPNLDASMGAGVFARISDAISTLNLSGQSAAVRFLLLDATYSSETLPMIVQNPTASATNTLTIQPAAGVTSTVRGSSSTGVFVFATPYVTLNGDNVGGSVGRNLTIYNTSNSEGSYVVGLFNFGAPFVGSNCTVKNNNIMGGVSGTTNAWGVILNAVGGDFDNVVIDNNQIQKVRVGIQFAGVTGATSDNGKVTNNVMGSSVDSLSVYLKGVLTSFTDNLEISGNNISGQVLGNATLAADPTAVNNGITLINSSINSKIFNNVIHDFYYNLVGGYGGFGIVYAPGATTNAGSTNIYNNMIYNIKGDGDDTASGAANMGYLTQGICVYTNGTALVNIYYNSIYLSGNVLGPNFVGSSACIGVSGAVGAGSLNIRNNILQNSQTQKVDSAVILNHTMGFWVAGPGTNAIFSNINYNDYYVNGYRPLVGYFVTAAATLPAWQTLTAKDANSITGDPKFTSTSDLSILTGSAAIGAGTPIAGITTDIFGTTRSVTTPTIGADETATSAGATVAITFRLEAIQLTRKDTVTVSLRTTVAPYPVVETKKALYDSTTGTVTMTFASAVNGTSYYLFLSHRNSISTWSAAPVLCTAGAITYDFTTATSKAYGSNMKLVSGKASYFTGDVDRNGLVDLTDVIGVYNASSVFTSGNYVITDLNYDGFVDLTDVVYASNNSNAFVQQVNPPGALISGSAEEMSKVKLAESK